MRTIGRGIASRLVLAAALVAALGATGCALATRPANEATSHSQAAYSSAVTSEPAELTGASAVNAFGFDLMRERLAESPSATGNVVLSPLSVHAALSMALQGAAGKTAAEMQRTLHLSGDATAAASTYSLLLAALDDRSKEQTLSVANALWIDSTLAVKPEFLNANRISFGASARTLDFKSADVAGIVNAWVAEKTQGMVTHVIDRIDPRAVMLLGDAVYFKASWGEPFNAIATRPQLFHPSNGRPRSVPMMHEWTDLPVVKTATYSATRLGYKGGDSEAYLILPDSAHHLDDVLSRLTSTGFADLGARLDSVPPTLTALALPKFDTTVGSELTPTLRTMGMPSAFDSHTADFSGMATLTPDNPIFIESVIHKARLKVEEKGTEAAAATIIEMATGSVATRKEPTPVPFICDRPFAFAIVDRPTGALLFLAAINDPRVP